MKINKILIRLFFLLLIITPFLYIQRDLIFGKKNKIPDAVEFPYKKVWSIDHTGEPSGIVYHPHFKTLFLVGDEGDLYEIDKTGSSLKEKKLGDSSYEGITCNPVTGLLYIAVEKKEKILEVDPESLEIIREFTLERTFNEKLLLKEKGDGIEGITFVPDKNHSEGGTFYIGNQSDELEDTEDISAIFEIELPLNSSNIKEEKVPIKRYFTPRITDISGLCYDAKNDLLYVICDKMDSLFEITRKGIFP